MNRELSKTYEPQEVESRIYGMWERNGCFEGRRDPDKKPFTIVMPPPNVTGQLHMGHAMDCTMQDILIRFKRMEGYAALWVPGTDHAGIATQIKVEEALRTEEGLTRHDLGRDKFLERVWDWKAKYGGRIVEQQKKLGASCDWSRARFTMDEGLSAAVRHVFVEMYNKGLIYKGSRIINWCPHCTTALSDAEVEYKEKPGHFWHLKYPIKGEPGRYVIVATTRPETMLGDTGVAVNPNDDRYRDLVGKTCILPLMDKEIPIVADEYVDMEFGTGCVKMTPAHDPNDFEVGVRHNLESIRVLDDSGKINENGGKYQGMDRYEARKAIVADLDALGLLEKITEHTHNVGTCYRCGTDVEPLISAQWFVKMEPLAKEALRVVNDGEVKFVPDRFSKIYTNWMENVHDWCISRQLWWGHRIPAWTCDDCGRMTVSETDPTECDHCRSTHIHQEEDVLDTWFSSALWPFSTLGWPDENAEDYQYFYPTDVLVTAYDIIFFWVARMIFSGCEHTKKPPFHTVFIHGIIRDEKGRKMSKSLGNGIDPLVIAEQYGADALRFNLVTGNSPGNDMRFLPEKCEAMRNFANKIWNASRFLMMNLTIDKCELPSALELEDKWILSKLNSVIPEITENMDKYELGVAAQKVYDFIWDSYCDWYIELCKSRLQGGDEAAKVQAQQVLCYVLTEMLKLLHPFMPFITEEIWQALPHEGEYLMLQKWPEYRAELSFPEEEGAMELVMEAISAVRTRRAEMNVPPSKKARLTVVTDQTAVFELGIPFLKRLAYADAVEIVTEAPSDAGAMVSAVTHEARMFMPMSDLVDMEKEKARMEKELGKNKAELEKLETKLQNPGFINKAPANVVAAEQERAEKLKSLIAKLEEQLSVLA
ncbi:valine--tRNA ligase [Pseudoflavonifractor sp. BIOML-A6]|nr:MULTISPECIES: valine--tRNA ligase [unclassified Pseudoflavonifractor]MTQ96184.1 valine--tRNA ligase [Pseudoflavonifractor sp. BIOML-A16]MTR06324.1 valine--tRNA ligase [Pseudoflavonifractor sp. BIOML-A15]MTR33147.1 valine--tRNA ligase [Pseudoflavonifractor sp. BIOML-A14]MTR73484.1 valine--tRNA ligase [Pseudoflavonifractor sp. BIOML-A18]MTS63840.1 valine--tRNA ligase [Pseudoflavonifractor sp. BIOML-A5]MTS72092.1 valine--tRNA ligase [Pseudoflavonifractor sp. BIOML-A8]MTS91233.1 valine--tRNA 